MASEDALEVTLATIRKVFLFQIPPRSSSEGYRAKEWPTDAFWTGRLRMMSQGSLCTVRLEHSDKGT
jgi:adaptin ear-binding coat-associated protein 1/2